jgi:hypothetical protein
MSSVTGIDVSHYNAMANLGSQEFQFARATYGTSLDGKFLAHMTNAKNAGIVAGAYHFATAGSVAAQLDAFVGRVRLTGVKLVALDLEFNGGNTMTNDHGAQFIAGLRSKGYPNPVLYHSRSGFPHLGQAADWIADWDTDTFPPGSEFWQYNGAPLDRDKWNGTLTQLKVFAGIAKPPTFTLSIQPLPGHTFRAFNTFNVTGYAIDSTDVARTGGLTLPCSAPARFLWSGHAAQMLVRPIVPASHRLYGKWVRAAWMVD